MKLIVFILEDVSSIRSVTDLCYASSVKTELNEYRQDEIREANNARAHKLNWCQLLIWPIFLMFTVSEGNTVKRMEDIFWKTEKILSMHSVKNIFFIKKIKGKMFGFLLNLQTSDIFGSLQKTFEMIWNCWEKLKPKVLDRINQIIFALWSRFCFFLGKGYCYSEFFFTVSLEVPKIAVTCYRACVI